MKKTGTPYGAYHTLRTWVRRHCGSSRGAGGGGPTGALKTCKQTIPQRPVYPPYAATIARGGKKCSGVAAAESNASNDSTGRDGAAPVRRLSSRQQEALLLLSIAALTAPPQTFPKRNGRHDSHHSDRNRPTGTNKKPLPSPARLSVDGGERRCAPGGLVIAGPRLPLRRQACGSNLWAAYSLPRGTLSSWHRRRNGAELSPARPWQGFWARPSMEGASADQTMLLNGPKL
jgi:hypothetical protein